MRPIKSSPTDSAHVNSHGQISVSETYISREPVTLDRLTSRYQLSTTHEPLTRGPHEGYRTYGTILTEEDLEVIRSVGGKSSHQKGEIGRNLAIKVMMEKLGFPEENIIVKLVHHPGVDIPATDIEGKEVAAEVKLTTSRSGLGGVLNNAIKQMETYLTTGLYDYGYAFAVFADRSTGEMVIEWVKLTHER